jgi:hypothetical protein
MFELKHIKPLSDWLEYRLVTDLLSPPAVIRVRVRPGHGLDATDAVHDGARKPSTITLSWALAVIEEWELPGLTMDGKPVPCTDAVKKEYTVQLKMLLASRLHDDEPVEETKEGEKPKLRIPKFAASEIVNAALDEKTFLKN